MHLKLIEESDRRLRFRNARGHGWTFVVVGSLLGAASVATSGATAWFALLFSLLTLAVGGRAVLARGELTLDLLERRFDGHRGYWPSPQSHRGSFDQIEAVALHRSRRKSDDDSIDPDDCEWTVALELAGWSPLVVYWSLNEDAAVEQFEHYAELLQVPAVDRSGRSRSVEVKDIIERLDRLTSVEPVAGGQPSAPPAGGSVVWREAAGAVTIELRRGGYVGGAWFPALFVVAFLGVGGVFLSSATGLVAIVSHRGFAWGGGILFSVIGFGILGLLTLGLCSRQIVREEADELLFELNMLGRAWHSQRWPKQEVESVVRMKVPGRVPAYGPSISEDEQLGSQANEVIIRRGDDVVRLARGADESTQQWLCRTLQQLVSR